MPREWTQDLAVGVQEIDEQHKALYQHLNDLLKAMSQGQADAQIGPMLDFLAHYALTHFAMEERYMARYSYPSCEAHRMQHQAFIREFGVWKAEFQAKGAAATLVLEIHRRVADWLTNHITRTDKLLGKFLQAKMAGSTAAARQATGAH